MRALLITALTPLLLPLALTAGDLPDASCPTASLTTYERNFGGSAGCTNGILDFYGFNLVSSSVSGGATLLSTDDIMLSPALDGPSRGQLGNTGIDIGTEPGFSFSVGAGQTAQYVIDWFFSIDNGPSAGGASLDLDPPQGGVSITQYICVDSDIESANGAPDAGLFCNIPGEFNTYFAPPPIQHLTATPCDPPSDVPCSNTDPSITLEPPAHDYADIRTIINLDGTGPDQSASFDNIAGRADIVPPDAPEPGTWLLAAAGLIGFGLLRNSRAKQRI